MVGAFVRATEAVAAMMNLYGLDPPCEGLGPGWERAYGGLHGLAIAGGAAPAAGAVRLELGEGYQYLTRRGMVKTMWVQCVRGQGYEGTSTGRDGGGGEERVPSENERIRHDLIPLQWQSDGWSIGEVPPMWCAAPWAENLIPNTRSYSEDIIDALDRGEWRPPLAALPTLGEVDRALADNAEGDGEDDDRKIIVDNPAFNTAATPPRRGLGPRAPFWKVIPAFGPFPPKIVDLSSGAATEEGYGSSHVSDGSDQSSSEAQRHSGGPASWSKRVNSSRSDDGAVQISSPSSYHSRGSGSLSAVHTAGHAQTNTGSPGSASRKSSLPAYSDPQKSDAPSPSSQPKAPALRKLDPEAALFSPSPETITRDRRAAEDDDDEDKVVRAIKNSRKRSLPSSRHSSQQSQATSQAEGSSGIDTNGCPGLLHTSASSTGAFDEIFGPDINRSGQYEEIPERLSVDNPIRDAEPLFSDDIVSLWGRGDPSIDRDDSPKKQPQILDVGSPAQHADVSSLNDGVSTLNLNDKKERQIITRRESGFESAEAIGNARTMPDGLQKDVVGERRLGAQPDEKVERPLPSSVSYAVVASKGNAGKENVNLKALPHPESRALRANPKFKAKAPEWW